MAVWTQLLVTWCMCLFRFWDDVCMPRQQGRPHLPTDIQRDDGWSGVVPLWGGKEEHVLFSFCNLLGQRGQHILGIYHLPNYAATPSRNSYR